MLDAVPRPVPGFSQSVHEIGPLVSQLLDLGLGLTFDPVITLAVATFRILPPKQDMLKHTSSEQK
jgi:hypothetical protein